MPVRVVAMAVNPPSPGAPSAHGPVCVVSAAKIREFAEAVGAADPVHVDPQVARERGYADVIAPDLRRPHRPALRPPAIVDPDAGIDFSRVVHGEQKFVHHRLLTAGDVVVGTLTVDSIRQAGGHSMVVTRSELDQRRRRAADHGDLDHRRPGRVASARRFAEVPSVRLCRP